MNNLYKNFTHFLHNADLLPFVIVVSVYHYAQALKLHDPLFVAAPVALFVDILHYRTVKTAVRGDWKWKAAAGFMVALSFGLQFVFYSSDENIPHWQQVLFSSVIPFGVVLFAWLNEAGQAQTVAERVADETEQLRAELEQERENCGQARAKNEQLKDTSKRWESEAARLWGRVEELRTEADSSRIERDNIKEESEHLKGEINKRDEVVTSLVNDIDLVIAQRNQLQERANAGEQAQTLLDQIGNPLILDILEMSAAGNVNAGELMEKHGTKKTATHSRIKFVLGGE